MEKNDRLGKLLGSAPLDNIKNSLSFERVYWLFFTGSALLHNPSLFCSAYHFIIMKWSKTLPRVHSSGYNKTK